MPATNAASKTDFSIEAIMNRGQQQQSLQIELNNNNNQTRAMVLEADDNNNNNNNHHQILDLNTKRPCNKMTSGNELQPTVSSPSYSSSSSSSSSSSTSSSASSLSSSSLSTTITSITVSSSSSNNNNKLLTTSKSKSGGQQMTTNIKTLNNQQLTTTSGQQHNRRNSSEGNNQQHQTGVLRSPQIQFYKGNMVQLAGGKLKKVEELSSKDFIECAQNSSNSIRVDSSIVKDLQENGDKSLVMIRFIVESCRNLVSMEVPSEHPFFVYDQGWSSMAPQKTLDRFGLKCRKLRIADVCITLTAKQSQDNNNQQVRPVQQQHQQHQSKHHHHHQQQQQLATSNGQTKLELHSPLSDDCNMRKSSSSSFETAMLNYQQQKQQQQQHLDSHIQLHPGMSTSGVGNETTRNNSNNDIDVVMTNNEENMEAQMSPMKMFSTQQSQSLLRMWIEQFAPYLASKQQPSSPLNQHPQQAFFDSNNFASSLHHHNHQQQHQQQLHHQLQQFNQSCHEMNAVSAQSLLLHPPPQPPDQTSNIRDQFNFTNDD